MITRLFDRYLDPTDSLGELLFGLIMALTVTLGARLLTHRSEIDAMEIVIAMVGCNVAWGVIDAVLYLIGSVFSRNRRVHFVRRLKAARNDDEAMAAIREEFGLQDEPALPEQDRIVFHRTVLDILRHADTTRAHVRGQDLQAAAAIVFLVSVTAVPGVLPLLAMDDGYLALRVANLLQVVLLFLIGFSWAKHTGANAWRTGFVILGLGVALVGVAVALGG